jgi:hypothetical protein
MPIPTNIQREHIFQAIIKIMQEGIPDDRFATKYLMYYQDSAYPCKLLISWANIFANGTEIDPNPNNFQSINAVNYLRNLGFSIAEVS